YLDFCLFVVHGEDLGCGNDVHIRVGGHAIDEGGHVGKCERSAPLCDGDGLADHTQQCAGRDVACAVDEAARGCPDDRPCLLAAVIIDTCGIVPLNPEI